MGNRTDLLLVDDFIDLLSQLDGFLDARDPAHHLTIRAIGGFSLMYHEQETSLTMLRMGSSDIDTLTKLPRNVATMVDIIAVNNGAPSDWLNNRWYANHDFNEELERFIVWEPTKYEFRHITLLVANLEGILLMKIRAVCEALEFAGYPANDEALAAELRTQDIMDVISLLRFFDVASARDFSRLNIPSEINRTDLLLQYLLDAGILGS